MIRKIIIVINFNLIFCIYYFYLNVKNIFSENPQKFEIAFLWRYLILF